MKVTGAFIMVPQPVIASNDSNGLLYLCSQHAVISHQCQQRYQELLCIHYRLQTLWDCQLGFAI